jgi:topoisomerase-4 subunit A
MSITGNLNSHIACVSKNSKILIFETKFLPILRKGGGVQLQKIKKDEALSDIQSFNLSDGVTWKIGSQLRIEKDINFWIGKRAQVGKKVPKRFNKNLKFFNE